MFARTDFNLARDGIFSKVAVPPRDQLGRFLGNLPGYDDDEDCVDCTGSVYALVAETITADLVEETSEDDDEEDLDSFIYDTDLTKEEVAELILLADKFDWRNIYDVTPADLTTLRRLDGLRWIEETYGKYMDPVVVAVKARTSDASGFGSGEKSTLNQWECDRIHGRRGYDDGRKKRKAMFNRQLRANRQVRIINIIA